MEEITVTQHAKNQARNRFGFSEQDILDIVAQNDKLSEDEKILIWASRPLGINSKIKVKKTDDYFYYNGVVAVVNDSHVITVYEAKYIEFERKRNKKEPIIPFKKSSKDFVSRSKTLDYYELYQNGHTILIKGIPTDLFVEGDLVRVRDFNTPLCHFLEKHVKIQLKSDKLISNAV